MIEYHNPEAKVSVEKIPYELSAVIKGANAINIGFLANGFPDSVNFLHELESAMQNLEPGIEVFSYNKGNASVPASDSLLLEVKGQCAAVVAAYGHWGSCTTGTVRDGVNIAKMGIPAVALVTEEFWPQGDFVAESLGMPDIPRIKLPHPVAGTGKVNLKKVAEEVAPAVIKALEAVSD